MKYDSVHSTEAKLVDPASDIVEVGACDEVQIPVGDKKVERNPEKPVEYSIKCGTPAYVAAASLVLIAVILIVGAYITFLQLLSLYVSESCAESSEESHHPLRDRNDNC
ncbi:uncharacterized protein LOC100906310 [Galendromus occidentalis]|uniref:Uncharacterized protein LOC100906310 n=1 Tax=Galendromus occidentalis TaxID=34638 RepID=A0AAJ6QUL1_9ACAR|nr:uncharacterized protein LOC100906310 [Galendromus occidentalis]